MHKSRNRSQRRNKPALARVLYAAVIASMIAFYAPVNSHATTDELRFPDDYTFITELSKEIAGILSIFRPEISGHVLSIDDEGVFLNVGSLHGVKVGMRFAIHHPTTQAEAIVQIDRVENDFSHGLLVSGAIPDLMYGAEYIQDETRLRINIPQSAPEDDAHIFLRLADEIEATGGWKATSVGNNSWRYTVDDISGRPTRVYMCDVSFSEGLIGRPIARFTITTPEGGKLEGGITYRGEWVLIGSSRISDDSRPRWFNREGKLQDDAFAIETVDINGDGIDELVVGGNETLTVYRFRSSFLEPMYIYRFTQPLLLESPRGETGHLGVLGLENAERFFLRGPTHASTATFRLANGSFVAEADYDSVPVANISRDNGIVMAHPLNGSSYFSADSVNEVHPSGITQAQFTRSFSFVAKGNFVDNQALEPAILDSNSLLWLYVNGEWTKQNLLLGAGLWGFDVDLDGIDEIVTTSREVDADRLEFYKYEEGYTNLYMVSPSFEGRIIDVAFGDMDGDGNVEPVILIAFGFERKIIF